MTVKRKAVVTIDYSLKDDKGNIIDSSEGNGPLSYLHGFKNIVLGLEEALEGKSQGDSFSVVVPPDKGYGLRDENMVFDVPLDNFKAGDSSELKPGMEFDTVIENTGYILTVVEVKDKTVKVDANHPLSGKSLYFDIKVVKVRDSYSEEIVQGFPQQEE